MRGNDGIDDGSDAGFVDGCIKAKWLGSSNMVMIEDGGRIGRPISKLKRDWLIKRSASSDTDECMI